MQKYKMKKGQKLTLLNLQLDVLQLPDICETSLRRPLLSKVFIHCTVTQRQVMLD